MSISSSTENKIFIEKIKTLLRIKIKQKEEAKCSMDEVYNSFSDEEKVKYNLYNIYKLPQELSQKFKDNNKIKFNLETKTFTFRHKFNGVHDLIRQLYHQKIGVLENEDLYDDVDKLQLQKVSQFLRRIEIKEKKTKDPVIAYFAKNYESDEVDKLRLEETTPVKIREYWSNLDINRINREKKSKVKILLILRIQLLLF